MSNLKAKIAHISDLHFGDCEANLIQKLNDKILEENPHILVVSGDILENPPIIDDQHCKEAITFLENISRKLPQETNPNCILAIGNHDVDVLGNINISLPLRLEWLTGGIGYRMKPPTNLFKSYEPLKFHFLKDINISIFVFDSTPNGVFNFAFGTINDKDMKTFENKIKEINSEAFKKSFKIAILHHHPLPISYSGSEKIALLTNAGTFLQKMLDNGIDIILHGHKHIFGVRRYSSVHGFADFEFRDVFVIGSGSPSKRGAQPFSFNVIDIYTDNSVRLRCFMAENAESPFVLCREIPLIAYHSAKRRAKRKTARHLGYIVNCIEKVINLNEDGDSEITIKYTGLEIKGNSLLEFLPIDHGVEAGQIKDLNILHPSGYVSWEKDTKLSSYQKLIGKLSFKPSRSKTHAPITVHYAYKTLNGHAMTDEEAQTQALYNKDYESSRLKITSPCNEFKMTIKMPDNKELLEKLNNDAINLVIYDDNMQLVESGEEKKSYAYFTEKREILLDITNPMVGFAYEVRWPLPTVARTKSNTFTRIAKEIQTRLLRLHRNSDDPPYQPLSKGERIQKSLALFRNSVENIVTRKWDDEEFDVSLMVPDEKKNLIVVSCLFDYNSSLWGLAWPAGVGLCWKAFKSNRMAIFPPEIGMEDYYVMPDEFGARFKGNPLIKHAYLFSIPFNVYDEQSNAYQIGVINIGSQHNNSFIKEIFEGKNENHLKNAVKTLYTEINEILTAT